MTFYSYHSCNFIGFVVVVVVVVVVDVINVVDVVRLVREVYEELLEAEESWTQFTTKVDRHLNQHRAQPLTEDQVIPHNINIKNIRLVFMFVLPSP